MLAGKVLAYGLLGFVVAGLTLVLLVNILGVPSLADPGALALVVGLLLLASLGLGLLIAVLSDSERQAVQLALLVLLASVFFSGFVLSIDQFTPPVRALAYLLPVTHGIQLLQDLMLRGTTNHLGRSARSSRSGWSPCSRPGCCSGATCAPPDLPRRSGSNSLARRCNAGRERRLDRPLGPPATVDRATSTMEEPR